jgi:hypothetical protein
MSINSSHDMEKKMKKPILSLGVITLVMWSTTAFATFVSGSTGSLGAFNPTGNTVVTLPPDGVLNYTTINIPAGVTVTFAKNTANTSVYMLATGDVAIAGTINLDGTSTGSHGGLGGPGGYNGGYSGTTSDPPGQGQGPGGGMPTTSRAGGGSYGTAGTGPSGPIYGNPQIIPLIGGSGGGGSTGSVSTGGGGGGAILVASSGSISITGNITAKGGNAYCTSGGNGGGGGSGGAIRLVANSITGNGTAVATGGLDGGGNGNFGGVGRIRLEAYNIDQTLTTNPSHVFGYPPSSVFIPNLPTLTITSIAGMSVPANPTGNYNFPDVLLPSGTPSNSIPINISSTNIPDGTSVTVSVIPQYGTLPSVNTTLSGSTATANVTLSATVSNVVAAQATFTIVGLIYDGEEIEKVRVATILGGKSDTTYITKSGKEIKGELVAALMK